MGRGMIYVFVYIFLTWKEIDACFSKSYNKTVYVKTGADYYNECECNAPGYSIKNLQWLDIHDQPIDQERPGTGQRVFTIVNESCCVNLHIPFMTKAISGPYKCVTNFEGHKYEQLHYVVAYDPITINPPEKQHLILGDRSLIRCEVHSEPHSSPIVTWYKEKDGNLIRINPSDKYVYTSEGLYINEVTMEDRGKYSCTALDIVSSDGVDKDIDVEIVTAPVITALNAVPGEKLEVGDQLRIECIADGIPPPEYIFTKIDENSTNSPRWEHRYNTIVIQKLEPEDQGTYECLAQSMAGVVSQRVFIQVLVPPRVTYFPNITVQEDQTIQLVCRAEGRPTPNISIIFINEDTDLHELEDNDLIENLELKQISRKDKGIYVCNASNEVDFDLMFMNLNVEYKPRFDAVAETVWGWDGKIVNLSCPYDSNPPSKVIWRYQDNEIPTEKQIQINQDLLTHLNENGNTFITFNTSSEPFPYGVYECKAVNPLGEDTKLINFNEGHMPPGNIRASVLNVQHTSAIFNLLGPEPFEGPEIQGYTSEYDKTENYNITHIHINRTWSVDRPFIIDTLDPNTTYFIRFSAINQVGIGPWSDILQFQTLEPSVPDLPEWDTTSDLINITSIDQEIRWSPVEGNGADPLYYTLTYCMEDVKDLCNVVKVSANADLKLDNTLMDFNSTYLINLTANNVVGESEAASLYVVMLAEPLPHPALLSAGALIGISVLAVLICLLLLDLLLCLWRKQGILASCCIKKKKSKTDENVHTRDKKGLLKDNREPEDTLKRPDNRHKEFEYNKTTGIITGRHSAV